ncbi:MAG TPA: histidinol dehydrogenase, partial [Candidatus Dormibacteraeota bacterium]
ADLAEQLEHDPLAIAVLVTDSAALSGRVEEELENLLLGLERADIIRAATCSAIVVRDLDEAMKIANEFAPEHLLIVTDDASARARQVENAGAVFAGAYATVPLGDYTAGPNHTLPTSGSARFASPLGVRTFTKQMSVLSLDRADLDALQQATVRLAQMEGLGAHAHAVEVRLE